MAGGVKSIKDNKYINHTFEKTIQFKKMQSAINIFIT